MDKTNVEAEKKVDPNIPQIAFAISNEKAFQLMKNIAKSINQKLTKKPKKNCKHCQGRGYIGFLNGVKSLPVPCRCVYVRKAF